MKTIIPSLANKHRGIGQLLTSTMSCKECRDDASREAVGITSSRST